MTLNIINIDAVDIRASMEAKAVLAMHSRYKPDMPPDNFLEDIIADARRAVEAGDTKRQIPLVSFWWCGDKSGKSWDEIFVKHIVKKIHGKLGLFVTWEQGPSLHLVIENGRIAACPIPESSTVLSEAGLKQRAKALAEATRPRLPEDVLEFLKQVAYSCNGEAYSGGPHINWLADVGRQANELLKKYLPEKTG